MSNLLRRVKQEGNPLIDGDTATFVWEGKKAPYLHLENRLFVPVKMQRVKKHLWMHQETYPLDAYIEYNFAMKKNKPKSIVPDPYNSNIVDTGIGHDNHYFSMPNREHTHLTRKRRNISKGTVTKHRIKDGFFLPNMKRRFWLYQPPTDEPVPLLVVLDGKDYKQRGYIIQMVDNMIADGRIQPIALALINNAKSYRTIEYNQNESIPMILERSVLPIARQELNLLDISKAQGSYSILGASMGGLMALYIGLRLPHIFGKVISQAGAFFTYPDQRDALIHVLVDSLPTVPIKIWLDCGIYDFLYDFNQDMMQRLETKKYDVTYMEHSGGHNYTSWRDLLPSALESMFGV